MSVRSSASRLADMRARAARVASDFFCSSATAVCSVSDQPATLLVCLNRRAQIAPFVSENRILCVNTLRSGGDNIADVFAGRTGCTMAERFNTGTWSELVYNLGGDLSGQVTPTGFRISVRGEALTANMEVIVREGKQIVEIQFFSNTLIGLTLVLSQG